MKHINHKFNQYKELISQKFFLLQQIIKKNAKNIVGVNIYENVKKLIVTTKYGEKKYYSTLHIKSNTHSEQKKISVVIPTYNAQPYLHKLIQSIQSQKLVNTEIFITDSQSEDKTVEIAKELNLQTRQTKRLDFNHGKSRNFAAFETRGKYLLFMVQDAIPNDDHLFIKMLNLLNSNMNVAAVSTRQCPLDDADLFARWQTNYTYTSLGLEYKDYIFYRPRSTNFYDLPILIKRKLSLLDNVCCLVNKSAFSEVGGFSNIPIAEDIDLAIRLIEKGYSIGFLGSSCINHSHTRSPIYFLKRYYIGSKTQLKLYKEIVKSPFSDLGSLFATFKHLYKKMFNEDVYYYQIVNICEKIDYSSLNCNFPFVNTLSMIINNELEMMYSEAKNEGSKTSFEDKSSDLLLKKIVMSLLGLHLAKYVVDYRYSNNTDRLCIKKKLDTILAKNV